MPGTSTEVNLSFITNNIFAEFHEKADGWTGTLSGGAFLDTGTNAIELQGATAPPDYAGGILPTGYYTNDTITDLGTPTLVALFANMDASNEYPYTLIDDIPDIDLWANVDGNDPLLALTTLQVNIDPDGLGFNGWQNFTPGQYLLQKVQFRAFLQSFDVGITPVLYDIHFVVDVP